MGMNSQQYVAVAMIRCSKQYRTLELVVLSHLVFLELYEGDTTKLQSVISDWPGIGMKHKPSEKEGMV
jgi:hypothetical protein